MAITIDSTAAQTSVDPSSSVAGSVISLVPRLTTTETSYVDKFDNVVAKVSGVLGLTPTFKVLTVANAVSYAPWSGTHQTGFFSYDALTWTQMGNAPVYAGGNVSCSHTSAFTQDTVWFARDRLEGDVQIAAWITAMAAAYPTLFRDLIGGSSFVLDTFSAQTDELARTVAACSLRGFGINNGRLLGKQNLVLISGVHVGETWATTCYRQGVEWLLAGTDAEALALRNAFNILCLPLMNNPGRQGGHARAQFEVNGTQNDLNRHFKDSVSPFQTVGKNRTVLNNNAATGGIGALLDFHGFADSADDPMRWYTFSSPLESAYISALGARLGSGSSFGAIPDGSTETWGFDTKTAQLSFTLEYNSGVTKDDATAITLGKAPLLALYDILGSFDGVTFAKRGSAFGRGG